MRIALSQMDTVWENKQANYEKATLLAQAAAAEGADLLLLPEMSFTGFSMHTERTAENYPYETVEKMKELSCKYPGLAIGFGYAAWSGKKAKQEDECGEKENAHADCGKAYNCLEVVADGSSLMHYKKIHPFTFGEEGGYFQGGDRLAFLRWKEMTLSGFICYDLRFPEIFQISSRKSDFIFVLANWPVQRASHWELLLQARAVENQCYVAGVNRIGEGGGFSYEPGSMAFSPLGERLEGTFYAVNGAEEGFWLVEPDVQAVQQVRRDFPLKTDRREALYRKLYKE